MRVADLHKIEQVGWGIQLDLASLTGRDPREFANLVHHTLVLATSPSKTERFLAQVALINGDCGDAR